MGGMIIGVKEEIGEVWCEEEEGEDGVLAVEIRVGEERWRIVGVYVNGDMEKKMEVIKEWLEEQEERWTLIGGDFNARTGTLGGGKERGEEEEVERKSKDRKINMEGRRLVEGLEKVGWEIFNGCTEGDEKGEFTYTGGRGESVIDYVIGEEKVKERVVKLEVGDCIESDHHPLIITLERKGGREKGREQRGGGGRGRWTERGERIREEIDWDDREGGDINGELEIKVRQIGEELRKGERESERRKKRGWWDEECEEKRKDTRRVLRKWRKNGGGGEEYRKARAEYKLMCKRKKEEENEKWLKEAQEAKTEGEVWKVVNRERKRRRVVNEGIEAKEWKEHFMRLLGGVERKVMKGGTGRRMEDGEQEIRRDEIRKIIEKLKKGKAAGGDGVPNEVWRQGGERVE
ncbi:stress response protein nst1-like protein [Lasius niger]|uniref:Stress response protein nst1-like protein n=1 Tax=Lasius niger TaxID=67767 RepID=A0A0J7KK24_LASNI|nr:stress response protein nst1-like protein [Lasius niger]